MSRFGSGRTTLQAGHRPAITYGSRTIHAILINSSIVVLWKRLAGAKTAGKINK